MYLSQMRYCKSDFIVVATNRFRAKYSIRRERIKTGVATVCIMCMKTGRQATRQRYIALIAENAIAAKALVQEHEALKTENGTARSKRATKPKGTPCH